MKKLSILTTIFLVNFQNIFAAESLTLIPSDSNGKYGTLVEAFKTGDFQITDFYLYLVYLIDMLSVLAVSIAFIFVLVGAFKFATAYGDDDSITSARKTVINALLGLALASLAYIITDLVIRFATS